MGTLPQIPLIEDLTTGAIPPGSVILVEFTGASQWYNASFTIAAGWLKTEGAVSYNSFAHTPDAIRAKLNRLGINSEHLESENKLRIWDEYTITLGQKSTEKYAVDSLRVSDWSILFSQDFMRRPPQPNTLVILDNTSTGARSTDEKSGVELFLTRVIPAYRMLKAIALVGAIRGVYSGWAYEQMEAASDGIIDFKLDETADPPSNLMRIRSMRDVGFDGRWHRLKIGENFEITLEK